MDLDDLGTAYTQGPFFLQDNFVDTPTACTEGPADHASLPAVLQGADPATTPVMMYCTGGIRCDVYSTHLRRLGFQNLLTLQVVL